MRNYLLLWAVGPGKVNGKRKWHRLILTNFDQRNEHSLGQSNQLSRVHLQFFELTLMQFLQLSRIAVTKHLNVLRATKLVNTRSEGRSRVNSLIVAPKREILERWISKYDAYWSNTLLRVRDDAEEGQAKVVKKKRGGG